MGCSASKCCLSDAGDTELQPRRQQAAVSISAPTGGPVLVPPPYRDETGRPIRHASSELDHDTLGGALSDMATFLDQRGERINLVAVGGAVNTLYLRSRQSTHDVDFFLESSNSQAHHAIHEAAKFANQRRGGSLGVEWLNNATQLFMTAPVQRQLYQAALQQGTVVFDSRGSQGGLTVFAAPWSYAFCGKLNRLCDDSPRPYDLADAVVYIHQHAEETGKHQVGAQSIRGWCEQFNKNVTDEVLRRVDEAYVQKYGHPVIDWSH